MPCVSNKVPEEKERCIHRKGLVSTRKGLISTGADRSINCQSHCELRYKMAKASCSFRGAVCIPALNSVSDIPEVCKQVVVNNVLHISIFSHQALRSADQETVLYIV